MTAMAGNQAPAGAALAQARSFLFVPGNRPGRFAKAVASGADAVVIDFEDSVSADEKAPARQAVLGAWAGLQAAGVPLVVRINAPETEAGRADLDMLAHLPVRPAGVMVPKVGGTGVLATVASALPGIALLPLIESAEGYAALDAIARAPSVLRLAVGHIDFMADTGLQCSDDEHELAPLRFEVAMRTRLHRLAPAVDGVTVAIDDEAGLRADTQRALRFGFGAKLCIHPRQVAVVHAALVPSDEELQWARRVIAADAASGGAAVQLDGRMVDVPVVLQARCTIARANGRLA